MEKNIEIVTDIETLSLNDDCVILSVAFVAFNVDTGQIDSHMCVYPDLAEQEKMGRVIDSSTVMWWMQQSEAARLEVARAIRQSVSECQDDIKFFFDKYPSIERFWARGDLDWKSITSLFKIPNFRYSHVRDTRTFFDTLDFYGFEIERDPGVGHTALGDALHEARLINAARHGVGS